MSSSASHPGTASPCVSICQLDGELCIGCGRTRDEIAAWSGLDDAGKRAVNAAAAERRRRLGLPPKP